MKSDQKYRLPGAKEYHDQTAFALINGGILPGITLVYETFGTLSARKDNVILVCHALSTSSHVASHTGNPEPGWWEDMVGPGKYIDTTQFFVICINNLGSCYGSSSPVTINHETGEPYRMSFPVLTMQDIVHGAARLLDHLEIEKVHGVVSASMGAMLSLCWAVLYPERIQRFISISSCYRTYPYAKAFRTIQREIIQLDPNWQNGKYALEAELPGFVTARKLGHLSYRSSAELDDRFLNEEDDIHSKKGILSYLQYNAEKFTDKFDANCYLVLTDAMDRFTIAEGFPDANHALAKIQANTLIVSVSSDTLFLPHQQQELHQACLDAGVKSQFIYHESEYGHDAFLLETDPIGNYIKDFFNT